MVGFVSRPQQDRIRTMSLCFGIREGEGLSSRHDGINGGKPRCAVVWMHLVSLPGIVRQDDIWLRRSDL